MSFARRMLNKLNRQSSNFITTNREKIIQAPNIGAITTGAGILLGGSTGYIWGAVTGCDVVIAEKRKGSNVTASDALTLVSTLVVFNALYYGGKGGAYGLLLGASITLGRTMPKTTAAIGVVGGMYYGSTRAAGANRPKQLEASNEKRMRVIPKWR